MKIRLYSDNTIAVDISAVVRGLSDLVPSITWEVGQSEFRLSNEPIAYPKTYNSISEKIRTEIVNDDHVLLFTEKGYENNYFWDSGFDKAIIISLNGWEYLTTLPRSNGIVYFSIAILVRCFHIGHKHSGYNTGCINDFWQDKRGIDAGMRAAFICPRCIGDTKVPAIVSELNIALDHLSLASRTNQDILNIWARTKPSAGGSSFDVFLCHNSEDKDAVRILNGQLQAKGIRAWFDEEQLRPGIPWQTLLEEQIGSIKSAAVIVGSSGVGPWQDIEMRAFISEFVRRACPVIPAILEGSPTIPPLPLFMRQFTWVDFRKERPLPLDMLIWGITGDRPGSARP